MTHKSSFDIQTPDDFFTKVVLPQCEEFIQDNASSRKALIAVIVTYHMFEWAYGEKVDKIKSPLPSDINDLFDIARRISNETKHFKLKIGTKRQAGFSSAFSDGFSRPLIIVRDDKSEIGADQLLREMIDHWNAEKATGKF